jgi:hypothetical protein
VAVLVGVTGTAHAHLNPSTTLVAVRANTGITVGVNTWTVLSGCSSAKLQITAYVRSGRVTSSGIHVNNIDITYSGTRGGIWGRIQLWPGNGGSSIEIPTWGSIPTPSYTRTVQVNRWIPYGPNPIHLTHDIQAGNPDGCGGQYTAIWRFRPLV